MIAPSFATVFEAAAANASAQPQSPGRPWKPDGDAHLIYQWVKLEGKSQGWVALSLGIHQSTVSRVLQRYERWQAHARQRDEGRLDSAERLRAQRWLTYERNELIIHSCLRIAHELEGSVDASRSTIRRPVSNPFAESEVRTEHFTLDRTGMTARFLRLAFRVNMEQLKLAELDHPPLPAPLTAEEYAEEERQALADAAELAASARRRAADIPVCQEEVARETSVGSAQHGAAGAEPSAENNCRVGSAHHDAAVDETLAEDTPQLDAPSLPSTLNLEPGSLNPACDDSSIHHSRAPLHTLHILHTANPQEIAASSALPFTCAADQGEQENFADPCILHIEPPIWPGTEPIPSGAVPLREARWEPTSSVAHSP
jgi:hypothetical protein